MISGPAPYDWRRDPDRNARLDMAILLGDEFDVYLELTDREITLDIHERCIYCVRCDRVHLPDDPCLR